MNGKKMNHIQNESQSPPLIRIIKKKVDDLKTNIRRVQQAQIGNTSTRLQKHIRRIQKIDHVDAKHDPNNAHITEIFDTLKHMLTVKITTAWAVKRSKWK